MQAETERETAVQHLHDGAACAKRHRELIARLKANGRPAEAAEHLLAMFEALQARRKADFQRLAEQSAGRKICDEQKGVMSSLRRERRRDGRVAEEAEVVYSPNVT